MKKSILLLLFLLSFSLCFAQKEAYNWYFGNKAGIKFHTGEPTSYFGNAMISHQGCVSMSGSLGNLLFYSNGNTIWSVANQPMPNGSGLYASSNFNQPAIAFEAPTFPGKYYIVTTGDGNHPGCFYSIIDMSLNGGLGDVDPTHKNIFIPGTERTRGVVAAIKHANNRSVWVIVRALENPNKILSYLVDEKGMHSIPVVSPALKSHGTTMEYSMSKISPDGKFYVYATASWTTEEPRIYELYTFNNVNGTMSGLYTFMGVEDMEHRSNGMEFSADGAFFYTSIIAKQAGPPQVIRQAVKQYNMKQTVTQDNFERCACVVYHEDITNGYCNMQLGPDGKIYIAQDDDKTRMFLSRLNTPYLSCADSGFEKDTVKLLNGTSTYGIPLFMPSYLTRFEWQNNCLGDTTRFMTRFLPPPSQVNWDFDDPDSGPANVAYGANPKHLFTKAGKYHVTATIVYPREVVEAYTREVTIVPYPSVNIGLDHQECPGDTVRLNPGLVQGHLEWITGDSIPIIDVPSPGDYWLRVENNYGCVTTDTIHLTSFPAPIVDESALQYVPATCGGTNGEIHGLVAVGTGGFDYIWKNAAGDIIGNSQDITGLSPTENYFLWVTDGNGCTTFLKQYTVPDIGNNFVNNDDVDTDPEYCGFPNGKITITPDPAYADKLQYSIDGGNTWSSGAVFTNLSGGIPYNVVVRVTANPSCEWEYSLNPILLPELDGPLIDSVRSKDAIDLNADGEIHVYAQGAGALQYTLEGSAPQSSPDFYSLLPGSYSGTIIDENGCTTPFTIVVGHISSVNLSALAGNDEVCKGETAQIPLTVTNFQGITSFHIVLNYDPLKVKCLSNYANGNPSLQSNMVLTVDQVAGEITIDWNSSSSLTLPGTITLLDLVFETLQAGISDVAWINANNTSWFTVEAGLNVIPVFNKGVITINDRPTVSIEPLARCLGEPVTLVPSINPAGNYTYEWTLPDGSTKTASQIDLPSTSMTNAGTYRVVVNNVFQCSASASMNLTVHPLPYALFNNDTTIYFEDSYTLSANEGYESYLWSSGEQTSSINITAEGTYSVDITDFSGCSSTYRATLTLLSKKPFSFNLPNAFFPDGNGRNDSFRPVTDYEQITEFNMIIYNRWGQQIFETNDAEEGWNGKVDGQLSPRGLYYWLLVYRKLKDNPIRLRGSVTLLN
jgi:gliding motility-associated-like protein